MHTWCHMCIVCCYTLHVCCMFCVHVAVCVWVACPDALAWHALCCMLHCTRVTCTLHAQLHIGCVSCMLCCTQLLTHAACPMCVCTLHVSCMLGMHTALHVMLVSHTPMSLQAMARGRVVVAHTVASQVTLTEVALPVTADMAPYLHVVAFFLSGGNVVAASWGGAVRGGCDEQVGVLGGWEGWGGWEEVGRTWEDWERLGVLGELGRTGLTGTY